MHIHGTIQIRTTGKRRPIVLSLFRWVLDSLEVLGLMPTKISRQSRPFKGRGLSLKATSGRWSRDPFLLSEAWGGGGRTHLRGEGRGAPGFRSPFRERQRGGAYGWRTDLTGRVAGSSLVRSRQPISQPVSSSRHQRHGSRTRNLAVAAAAAAALLRSSLAHVSTCAFRSVTNGRRDGARPPSPPRPSRAGPVEAKVLPSA